MTGMPWQLHARIPLQRHHCPAGGGGGELRNVSIAYTAKTACRMHLGPSPFDPAPTTLRGIISV